jgi:hypothetical protein
VARRDFRLIDYFSQRNSIVFIQQLKHVDVG